MPPLPMTSPWAAGRSACRILRPEVRPRVERGSCNHRLELAAVVHALAEVAALDHTSGAIHIHADSEFVLGILKHVAKRARMPEAKAYRRISDLYAREPAISLPAAFSRL